MRLARARTRRKVSAAAYRTALPDVVITSVSWTPANIVGRSSMGFQGASPQSRIGADTFGRHVGGWLQHGWRRDSVVVERLFECACAECIGDFGADGGPSGPNYWTATAGPHTVDCDGGMTSIGLRKASKIIMRPMSRFSLRIRGRRSPGSVGPRMGTRF